MKRNCKHLRVIPQSDGSPLYKCDVNDVNMRFLEIKDSYEKAFRKTAIPNGECMFKYITEDLSICSCFIAE